MFRSFLNQVSKHFAVFTPTAVPKAVVSKKQSTTLLSNELRLKREERRRRRSRSMGLEKTVELRRISRKKKGSGAPSCRVIMETAKATPPRQLESPVVTISESEELHPSLLGSPRALEFGRAQFFRSNFRSSVTDKTTPEELEVKLQALSIEWQSLPVQDKLQYAVTFPHFQSLIQQEHLAQMSSSPFEDVPPCPGIEEDSVLCYYGGRFSSSVAATGMPADYIPTPEEQAPVPLPCCLAIPVQHQAVYDAVLAKSSDQPLGAQRPQSVRTTVEDIVRRRAYSPQDAQEQLNSRIQNFTDAVENLRRSGYGCT